MGKNIFVVITLCCILTGCIMGVFYYTNIISLDKRIELVVEDTLGKPFKDITRDDLKGIKKLDISGKGITKVNGIELLCNLEILNLEDNDIVDLSPLKRLTNLRTLNIGNNNVKHISHLGRLTNIEQLDISNNKIKSIDVLSSFDKLEDLNIESNYIENLRVLKDLRRLSERVYFHNNPIKDYGPVVDLYNKKKVNVFSPSMLSASTPKSLVINEVMASNGRTIVDKNGNYSDWIELYNGSDQSINLKGYGLSDRSHNLFLWRFPNVSIEAGSLLFVWASDDKPLGKGEFLRARFNISKHGETILLTNPEGDVIDAVKVAPSQRDVSFGRESNGNEKWVFSKYPSPGSDNIHVTLSHRSGFYTNPFDLTLQTNNKETTIYYTLDCTEPTQKSLVYSSPIRIKSRVGDKNSISEISTTSIYWKKPKGEVFKGTIIRARAYRDGSPVSNIITRTYFVDKRMHGRYAFPVISLVTDPANLFDYEKGIYTQGKAFDDFKKKFPEKAEKVNRKGNFRLGGKKWERPVHIDFFEPNGFLGFSQNVGIRLFGGPYTRTIPRKAFCLYPRRKYDSSKFIHYEIFPGLRKSEENNEVLDTFEHLLLRTSGQDATHTMFRDAIMQSLVGDILDTQAYRPAVVFLNSEYWGIYNIREHMDEHYLASHYGVDEDKVILLENHAKVKAGSKKDRKDFLDLLDFVVENDMTDQGNYEYIKRLIDIDNFIDYNLAEIYFNNMDWLSNNIRFWRYDRAQFTPDAPYGLDGRWRWLVYDTDIGFGLAEGFEAHKYNMLKLATAEDGVGDMNVFINHKEWSTRLLRSLLTNQYFRNKFINRFADYLNTRFKEEVVIEKIIAIKKNLELELQEHIQRWGADAGPIRSIKSWNKKVGLLGHFVNRRPRHIRKHIQDYFGLGGVAKVTLQVSGSSGGTIQINTIKLGAENLPWEGSYFQDVPVQITATPYQGSSFAGWKGDYEGNAKTITIRPRKNVSLTAHFLDQ